MNQKHLIIILTLFLFANMVNAQSVLETATKKIEEGKILLDNGKEDEALKLFESAIRLSRVKPYRDGNPNVFMLVGDAYLNCTKPYVEQAYSFYKRARDIDPMNQIYWKKLRNPIFDEIRKNKG
jgi:tetratricopeptide (TPR) repeat protein